MAEVRVHSSFPPWDTGESKSLLSQFINGDGDGNYNPATARPTPDYDAFRLENTSYNTCACGPGGAYYVTDYDLSSPPGCDCPATGRGAVSTVILRWSKVAIKKLANAYLGQPVLLAILPLVLGLVLGVGFGFWFGRKWERQEASSQSNRKGVKKSTQSTTSGTWVTAGDNEKVQRRAKKRTGDGLFGMVAELLRGLLTFLRSLPQMIRLALGYSTLMDEFRFEENEERDAKVREELRSDADNPERESGVDLDTVPRHVAVIMDGNRRYGRKKYGSATKGHWDGSKTLVDFAKWCIAEGIQVLTVYAFSTENWNREPAEVAALMTIFCKYCDELRVDALKRGIRLRVLSTETDRIPDDVKAGLKRMMDETEHCTKFTMNICLSYGSRGEIVNACRDIASEAKQGTIDVADIGEDELGRRLLTNHCSDPDVVIRTSGEFRLSNFLLWQLAYAEMFFLERPWPELTKEDLLRIIRTYSRGRQRRFGK